MPVKMRNQILTAIHSAAHWASPSVSREIRQAEAKLTPEQRAGRSQFTMSAAQMDQGRMVRRLRSHSGSDSMIGSGFAPFLAALFVTISAIAQDASLPSVLDAKRCAGVLRLAN